MMASAFKFALSSYCRLYPMKPKVFKFGDLWYCRTSPGPAGLRMFASWEEAYGHAICKAAGRLWGLGRVREPGVRTA
jgi:hypothetical protein